MINKNNKKKEIQQNWLAQIKWKIYILLKLGNFCISSRYEKKDNTKTELLFNHLQNTTNNDTENNVLDVIIN